MVLSDLDNLKDETFNDLLDQEVRWQLVTGPGELLHELELMDKAVRDLGIELGGLHVSASSPMTLSTCDPDPAVRYLS